MGHRDHRSELEHIEDALRTHRSKHIKARRAIDAPVMAAGAMFLIERAAILRWWNDLLDGLESGKLKAPAPRVTAIHRAA